MRHHAHAAHYALMYNLGMDPTHASPTRQSPGVQPSHRLSAVVVASYLALVALVLAAPSILHRPLQPSTWVRFDQHGAVEEVPPSKYSVEELVKLAPSIPRVRDSNVSMIIHQSYKSRLLPPEYYQFRPSW